jgi:hypothetical protein
MGRSSIARHEIVGETTHAARVDTVGVEHALLVRPVGVTDEQGREVAIFGAPSGAVGQALEQGGQLRDQLGVQLRNALPELRASQRRDPDLGEQQTALAVGAELEQEEIEGAGERTLGVEDVQLGHERGAEVFDHLIDGGDQQIFLGVEVVVDQTGRHLRLLGDALHRRVGEAVLDDGGAEAVDDLPAARLGEAGPSHK